MSSDALSTEGLELGRRSSDPNPSSNRAADTSPLCCGWAGGRNNCPEESKDTVGENWGWPARAQRPRGSRHSSLIYE
eukprot:9281073-Heterocapsa_arctica.AAC.1